MFCYLICRESTILIGYIVFVKSILWAVIVNDFYYYFPDWTTNDTDTMIRHRDGGSQMPSKSRQITRKKERKDTFVAINQQWINIAIAIGLNECNNTRKMPSTAVN